jgi:hypothetical protein
MGGPMNPLQGIDPQMLLALLGGQGGPPMGMPGAVPGGMPPMMGAAQPGMGLPGGVPPQGPPGQGPQGPPGQPGQGPPQGPGGKPEDPGMLGGIMQNPAMQMMLVALMAQLMGGNPQLAAILMGQGRQGQQQPGGPGGQPSGGPGGRQPQGNPFGGMF